MFSGSVQNLILQNNILLPVFALFAMALHEKDILKILFPSDDNGDEIEMMEEEK